jgi:UDP-N-acetylmuramoyl-L-alanyl-D-glutamate--2,6-diaminopimelate ligase
VRQKARTAATAATAERRPSRGAVPPARAVGRPPLPPGPYLVAGLGSAGQAATDALIGMAGVDSVCAWDEYESDALEHARRRLRSLGVRVWTGDIGGALDSDPAPVCIVKSPGIPPEHPAMVRARERGIVVLDELELGWRVGASPVIGVTGTNGKSTIVRLISSCLAEAGHGAAVAGNIEDGPPYSAVEEPANGWTICEASSYQLEASPRFLPEVGVLTNLTHDHLNRHRDMRAYAECKRRMFVRGPRCVGLAVVNMDDELGRHLGSEVGERGGRVVSYGRGPDARHRVRSARWDVRSATVEIDAPDGRVSIETRLPGPHNALNVAGAIAVAEGLELDTETAVNAISTTPPVPGRFEPIDEGQAFDAIVDFAHTPDAVRNVLLTGREILRDRSGGRLVAVVGAAGGVDTTKRPAIGRAASELADIAIPTSGNPRGETPESIVADVLEGTRPQPGSRVTPEPDRRAAIGLAVELADPGDLVMVLGRGRMSRFLLNRAGDGFPFDDREVLREALRGL